MLRCVSNLFEVRDFRRAGATLIALRWSVGPIQRLARIWF